MVVGTSKSEERGNALSKTFSSKSDAEARARRQESLMDSGAWKDTIEATQPFGHYVNRYMVEVSSRKAIEKSKRETASSTNPFHDPHALAEMRTRERVSALTPQWRKEDQEMEIRMHEKMMQQSGKGEALRMQQEMMKGCGYPLP